MNNHTQVTYNSLFPALGLMFVTFAMHVILFFYAQLNSTKLPQSTPNIFVLVIRNAEISNRALAFSPRDNFSYFVVFCYSYYDFSDADSVFIQAKNS
jgi:hypothetical protein